MYAYFFAFFAGRATTPPPPLKPSPSLHAGHRHAAGRFVVDTPTHP
jgi:hypothetical protein